MKIMSLNVNNFAGVKCKEEYKEKNMLAEWKKLDKTQQATSILAYIQKVKPVITILHEFELNTEIANKFIDSMNLLGYVIVPYENFNYINPSITIVFTKKELLYERLVNPHKEKSLRATVLKTADCIVYGVHIPQKYDEVFWEELIDYYKQHKEQKIVIIGDYNVFDFGTKQKEKYLQLVALNAVDVWLESGHPNETKTHIKGKRLDYAFMSPVLFKCFYNMSIDTYLMENGKTDHAALIIEI